MTSSLAPPPDGKTGDSAAPSSAASETTDAGPGPTEPPDAAVRWMVRYCPANAELAALSGVSVRWRQVVAATLADDVLRPYADHLSGEGGSDVAAVAAAGGDGANDGGGQSGSRSDLARLYPVARLLLPEMAMELLERRRDSMTKEAEMIGDGHGDDNTAGYSSVDGGVALVPIKGGEDEESQAGTGGTTAAGAAGSEENGDAEHFPTAAASADGEGQFCLAWFAPSGIQIQSVRVGDDGDDHSVSSSSSEGIPDTDTASRRSNATPPFGPSGQETYDLSETEEVADDKDKARRRGYLSGKDSSGGGGTKGGGGGGAAGGGGGGGGGAKGPSPAPVPDSPLRRRPPMNRAVAAGAGPVVKTKKSTDDASGRLQTCAHGWSSYLSAMDVLLPFGFSTSFVRVSFCLCITLD